MEIRYKTSIDSLAKNLTAEYNTIFEHSGDKGDSREKSLINFLKKVMPGKYGFSSGEIFDINDKNCGQVDIIIYDTLFSTVFTDGSNKIAAPCDSTYGIISCKSLLKTADLDNAILGIQNYEKLERQSAKNGYAILPDLLWETGGSISVSKSNNNRINCIYAGDTNIAIETIKNKLTQANCVDLLIIPNKYCVIGRHIPVLNIKSQGMDLSYACFTGDNSLSLFILILQTILSKSRLIKHNTEFPLNELLSQTHIEQLIF